MKNSILILLSAALPVFAQGPAPEAAPAPVAPAPQVAPADAKAAFLAKYDADKDGKISAAEAFAAKRDFMRANADKFGKKPGMRKHEGRRHSERAEGVHEMAFFEDCTIAIDEIANGTFSKHTKTPVCDFP